ncbi:MAG: glutamate--tRNA ligase [Robiginitomaculum sp.]
MPQIKIVTRFAPSPTGFLHIGGARTALFSYYFAKKHGGTFRLRIEDTDKKRSTEAATQAILDGMDWLGLGHDGDIIYQSKNIDAHKKTAAALLASGHAYLCYLTPDEQEAERLKSRKEGRAFRSIYRNMDIGTPDANTPFVVRFKVPNGETIVDDAVQGQIKWNNKDFDDLILLRADGTPVYMLAVVVDDHDMGVTHIIRGDDHLVNAGRQKLIYQALGWDIPVFAHIPLIFGPDGKKLSKRHGALGVDVYTDMGYLPAGLRNYLTRLGWSHKDMEVFNDQEVIKVFDLSDISKAPARLDFEKMAFINGQHMQVASPEIILQYGQKFLDIKNEGPLDGAELVRVRKALPTLLPRSKTLIDFAEQAYFLTRKRPIILNGKKAKPLKKPDAKQRLSDLHFLLNELKEDEWTAEDILVTLNAYIADNDIGFGSIGAPLRACLTGGAPSPDLAIVLALLGKNETLGRIEDCLKEF